jgi:hypothetical protein
MCEPVGSGVMPGGAVSIELFRPESEACSPAREVMAVVVRTGALVAIFGENDGAFEDFGCCCCCCDNSLHSSRRERNFDISTSVSCIGRQNILVLIPDVPEV